MKIPLKFLSAASVVVFTLFGTLSLIAESSIVITPSGPTGVYGVGTKATWRIELKGGDSASTERSYKIKKDGKAIVSEGPLDLAAGAVTVSAMRDDPGALVLQVFEPSTKNPVAVGGAIFEPEKIKPAAPAPKDFEVFWKQKLEELAKVPVNPVLEKRTDLKNSAGIDYYRVTLDNIRGTHVRGQLARPSAEGKYPAMVIFQHAGVYPLDRNKLIAEAKEGWLVLNISAHDQPIDESPEFYKTLNEGSLKNYTYKGSEDRETSYFLRMFLGCVRATNYLASRPDWDGKTLLVTGTSQGGLQAFVAAAFSPKVTGVMALVPAGCDVYSPRVGRSSSWPYWLSNRENDLKKVEATAGYFDGINFATYIKCPTLIAYGLADETARPSGIAAAINGISAPKEALILPLSDHKGKDGSQNAYRQRAAEWKKAAMGGHSLPPTAP